MRNVNAWHVVTGAFILSGVFALIAMAIGVPAALLSSERLGNAAGVFAVPAVIMVGIAAMCCMDGYPSPPRSSRPSVRYSRQQRRVLRDERQRIALAAEIARMEKEAGL